jgi:hypothetical protein
MPLTCGASCTSFPPPLAFGDDWLLAQVSINKVEAAEIAVDHQMLLLLLLWLQQSLSLRACHMQLAFIQNNTGALNRTEQGPPYLCMFLSEFACAFSFVVFLLCRQPLAPQPNG